MPIDNIPRFRFRDFEKTVFRDPNQDFGEAIRQNELSGMAKLPYELLRDYGTLARQGVYGEGGIQEISGAVRRGTLLNARRMGAALRRRLGRRLGPRSGAVDTSVINAVYPQALTSAAETEGRLRAQNYQSRLQGLSGAQDILNFLLRRYQIMQQLEQDEGGLLGTFGDIAGIGADIAGAFGLGAPGQGTAAKKVFE